MSYFYKQKFAAKNELVEEVVLKLYIEKVNGENGEIVLLETTKPGRKVKRKGKRI